MLERNERQYRLMLDQLTNFENDGLALDTLVDNLDGLLNALEEVAVSWKQTFLQEWGKLEDERAYALCKGVQAFDNEASEWIRSTVARLKLRVLEQIDDPGDKRPNNES
jgi:hypothetical protein